jgi:hypothetical protein
MDALQAPALAAAANYAAEMMREGDAPRLAITLAARHFRLPVRDVAAACGKRGGTKKGTNHKRRTQDEMAFDWLIAHYRKTH